MKILIITMFTTLTFQVHGLNLFARPPRRQVIPTRAAVINDSVFTLHNGRLYRSDRRDGVPKSFHRRPPLEKIARFGDLLVGLTYRYELVFWREGTNGAWDPVRSPLDVGDVIDFSANQNVMLSVQRRGGLVKQWSSLSDFAFVPGAVDIVGVEGYAAEVGFGLIRPDGSKLFLTPSKLDCDGLLVDDTP